MQLFTVVLSINIQTHTHTHTHTQTGRGYACDGGAVAALGLGGRCSWAKVRVVLGLGGRTYKLAYLCLIMLKMGELLFVLLFLIHLFC